MSDERLEPREGTQGDSDSTSGRTFDRGDVLSAPPVGGGNTATGSLHSQSNGPSNGDARTLRDKVRQLEKQLEEVLDARRTNTDTTPGIKLVPLPQRHSGSYSERVGDDLREHDGLRKPDFPMNDYMGPGMRPMLAKSRYLGGSHWMRGISLVSPFLL